jgi:6-phosphogluconolactonase
MDRNYCEIKLFANAQELSRQAASSTADLIVSAMAAGRSFSLCLAGGSTPQALYEILASDFREAINWESVQLFWGDERYVPADDPRSNYRMAERSLISRVPIPPENVHPMPTTFSKSDDAAREYENTLRSSFGGKLPRFDLVLLGMGEEGHTASLFPGSPAFAETERWVRAVTVPAEPPQRLTLTLPVLNNAAHIYFLISGANKAEALAATLAADQKPRTPASLIRPTNGQLVLWTDEAASKLLPKP